MSSPPRDDAQLPTRRERQRQATAEEIVQVSRRLLRTSEDGLSIRAVAAEMGLTAPALYRYVDSHRQLLKIVGDAVLTDVGRQLVHARDAHPADDPAAQLVATAVSFRRWAVDNREEFALVFANVTHSQDHGEVSEPERGFADLFGEIYLRVWRRYRFPVVDEEDFSPETLSALQQSRAERCLPGDFPGEPIGLVWHFLRGWMRLYGVVTLEVFKHMDERLTASGLTFMSVLDDMGVELNFGEDHPRLREVARAGLLRRTPSGAAPS